MTAPASAPTTEQTPSLSSSLWWWWPPCWQSPSPPPLVRWPLDNVSHTILNIFRLDTRTFVAADALGGGAECPLSGHSLLTQLLLLLLLLPLPLLFPYHGAVRP